ncbi:MAG TPA: ABC transporter ATP-binding protein [Thermoanaerobaculia bacterium]|nr:ABC transporter ATP-binding protein [Thermoanaerobaculia bacterium]
MAFLTLESLDKSFGDLRVLDAISLAVAEGEVLALLGPSGSGKTTLLRLLAGFEVPDGGRILLDGDDVAPLPSARRRFGMVFQHYALFPHLTVGQNVAFGLAGRKLPKVEVGRMVADALRQVDLQGFEERRPGEISGGQQQRVALARALAISPRVLLLDEPLSNLDPALRERTRRELRTAIERVGITTVLVTHEQEEAFDLGDRVAVLHRGRLEQVGRPEELYERPATRFVATFVGRAAVLPGQVATAEGDVALDGAGVTWRSPAARVLDTGALVDLVVRPEGLAFVDAGAEGAARGRVAARRYAGSVTLYRVELLAPRRGRDHGAGEPALGDAGQAVGTVEVAVAERGVATAADASAAAVGTEVHVAPHPEGPAPHAFPAGSGR